MAALNLILMQQHREILRGVGFLFCDDHPQHPDPSLRQPQQALVREADAAPVQELISEGVAMSTCDQDVHQSIGLTAC